MPLDGRGLNLTYRTFNKTHRLEDTAYAMELRRPLVTELPRASLLGKPHIPGPNDPYSTEREGGRQLFEERWNELQPLEDGCWLVPSDNLLTGTYIVSLRVPESPRCECRDFQFRNTECKHIHAARIAHRKSRNCSCCGQRTPRRFLTEVHEEHGLLAWFVGDVLCGECIRSGHWS